MKYRVLLSLVAVLFAINVNAQDEKDYPHAFVGVQGGVMRSYNGYGVERKWGPMGAINLGYNFTNVFGLRLQANGSTWTAETPNGDFKSKIGNIDLDMLFNLSNVFFPNQKNFVNVIAVAGAPFNIALPHAWVDNYARSVDDGDRWNPAWKVGGQLEFNVAKHWGINLEGGTNYVNLKTDGLRDHNRWWPYAMAGVTYKFGFKKAKKVEPVAPVVEEPAPVVKPEPKPEPKPQPKPEPKPEPKPKPVVKQPVKITENIFFDLAKAEIKSEQANKVNDIVKWANEHPQANIVLTGYADKETGNAKVNYKIAKQRANAVKDALVAKGIAADRLRVEVKGDTEQPFANNDDNRAVIAFGEEK